MDFAGQFETAAQSGVFAPLRVLEVAISSPFQAVRSVLPR